MVSDQLKTWDSRVGTRGDKHRYDKAFPELSCENVNRDTQKKNLQENYLSMN